MKIGFKLIAVVALMAVAVGCVKLIEPTPSFAPSTVAFSATASATTVAVAAADSTKAALTVTWNDPKFSVGLKNSKFTVMVGKAGANFTTFSTKEFTNALSGDLTGNDLNGMALKFGGVIGQPIALEMMVVASQANNNEPKKSDVLKVTVTPFGDLSLAASSTTVVTTAQNKDNVGLTLIWSPGFKGYEGARVYQLQYAKGGTAFATTVNIDLTTVNKTFTNFELNNISALAYGVPAGTSGPIDFRVRATNGAGSIIFSNTITVAVTPYETVYPSIWGMGAALNGWGPWDNPDRAVEVVGTAFQVYEMVAKLTQGEIFRFFAQYDWNPNSYNYNYFTTVSSVFELNPADGDNNFKVVGATGWYKVTVNLNTKVVTAVSVNEPVLFMMGAALNGWGPTWNETPLTQVKMTYKKPGVFEANPTFKVETFRFFAQGDWNPTSYNYPFFTTVDTKFENANDGDKNFRYIGTPGAYKIRVDLNKKTVVNF
jgi:starch-binding outer membrane protein SusE/F